MIQEHKASEKLAYLIKYGLCSEWFNTNDIENYFGWSNRQCRRLMNQVYDMQFDIGFYNCDRKYKKIKKGYPEAYLKIRLERKYL